MADPEQRPSPSPIPPPNTSSLQFPQSLSLSQTQVQARIATVIYDATLRGGPSVQSLITQLCAAYPTAAAMAHHYLSHTQTQFYYYPPFLPLQHQPSSQQPAPQLHSIRGAHFERHNHDFILRRINVSSIAWFCFFTGSLLASLRVFLIVALAFFASLARSIDDDNLYKFIDYVASRSLSDDTGIELYQWLFDLLTQQNPIHNFVHIDALAATLMLPKHIASGILLNPITAGILCFCLGGLAAVAVNFALRVAGGIRFQSRHD